MGVDLIYKKTKKINVLFIFFIAVIFIFMVIRNNSHLEVPNSEDLSSITFINVVNEKGIERVIVYEENEVFYIHQPYSGVFKIGSNDLDVLDEIIEKGKKESISMQLEDILKDNFKR